MILVLLFLGLELAAISPDLHELICPDADSPYDCCIVKQLDGGFLDFQAARVALVAVPLQRVATLCSGTQCCIVSQLRCLFRSRAPPIHPFLR